MKFTQIVCATLLCLLFAITAQGQKLTFSPEKPSVESEVSFTYDPAGGPLKGMEIAVIAYEYSDVNNPAASDIELTQKGEVYQGKFTLSKDAKAIFLKLISKGDYKIDNNNDQGYGLLVNGEGNKPVKGARIAFANGISPGLGSYLLDIKGDMTRALELYKKDFEAYPDLKKENLSMFSFLVAASTDPADMEMLNDHVQSVIDNKRASEEEMMAAYQLASSTENAEQMEVLESTMRKRFKKGQMVRDEIYQSFRKATSTEEKLKIYQSFEKKFANVEKAKYTLTNMASGLASSYANAENWEKFDEFIALVDDQDRLIGMYNNLAWGLAGAGLEGEGKSLEKAAELSMKSLEGTKEKMENPNKDEPSIYTPRELKLNAERSYAMYADTYALIMHKLGKPDEALKYQEIAAKGNKFKDAEMNERYCVYYEKIHGKMKCEELIAGMIKDGSATPKMKTRHKELFLENNSLETAYTKYLASLEADALKKIKEDLAKKMIDEAAPDFTLTNVAGETVQLSAMKDKVVVLDFWATWCGPCIMSFPGMARAQEELKEQQDVVFLFINTWENGDDKAKIAGDFMKKKGYPFNIPMDSEDKVVKSYGVDGIPTKFIIGPDNRIRFKSVGFNNNEDAMVAELKYMIEMAREGEGEMAVGAPR